MNFFLHKQVQYNQDEKRICTLMLVYWTKSIDTTSLLHYGSFYVRGGAKRAEIFFKNYFLITIEQTFFLFLSFRDKLFIFYYLLNNLSFTNKP